jgi:hypothetical protein
MKRGETLSATARAERARESTKAAIARELLYAGILARIWPAYVMKPEPSGRGDRNEYWLRAFPYILAVESPAGWLSWRLSPEEYEGFEWVQKRDWKGEKVQDRTAILLALATDGSWTR